ncbi:MAG: hypothetical protein PHE09_13245 [Oscillospiraceae bacterium]|nr:hypothetical protein [Oscillospiraceae bacterium]
MKKIAGIVIALLMVISLVGCGANEEASTEIVPENYGGAVVVAQNEFDTVFSDFDGIKITSTSTMVRSNDNDTLVVQFSYTSTNGSGVYGFEITRDDYGNYNIVSQGEDVTIDNLVKEPE